VAHHLWLQRDAIERQQRLGPIDGLGDPRALEEALLPQPLHEGHHLAAQALLRLGHPGPENRPLPRRVGVVYPVVQTPALQRVVNLSGAVAGQHHDGRGRGPLGAQLGNGDLEVGEDLQEERLERLIGAIQLVDEQHRRAPRLGLERLQEWPGDEEALAEDVLLECRFVCRSARFGQANLEHLLGVVPLVHRRGHVEALVALQPNEPATQALGQHLGDLRLANPRLTLEEEGPAQLERQEQRGSEAAVGDVVPRLEQLHHRVNAGRERRPHVSARWRRPFEPSP